MHFLKGFFTIFIFTCLSTVGGNFTNIENFLLKTVDLSSFAHFDLVILTETRAMKNFRQDGNNYSMFSSCQSFFSTFGNSSNDFDLKQLNFASESGFSAVFTFVQNFEELLQILIQIQDFYGLSKWSWSPYFFLFVDSRVLNSSKEMEFLRENFAPKFNMSSQVFLILVDQENERVTSAFEIYYVTNLPIIQQFQFWDSKIKSKNQESDHKLVNFGQVAQKTVRRSNFHQADIVAVNVDHPDYKFSVKYKPNNGTGKLEFESGFEVWVFFYLCDALNFSQVVIKWEGFVKPGPNGTLTGMAVAINTGKADVIAGSTEFLEYRASGPDGLTYLHPTFHNELLVFFKQPPASSIRDIFLLTFTNDLWAAIFGTYVLIILAFLVAIRIQQGVVRNLMDLELKRDVLLWSISTLAQQGWHTSPSSTSIKIIFLVGIVTGLLLYVAYSSSLVAILSVAVVPIRRFSDLIDYKFDILSDAHIPTTTQAVKSLEERGIIPTIPDGGRNIEVSDRLDDLVKSPIAIVSLTDSFFQVLLTRDELNGPQFACKVLSQVLFSRRPAISSMNIQRGSPLREYFNTKIVEMRERGVMFRLRSHYVQDTSIQCQRKSSGIYQQLGSKDVFTAYIILACGSAMSMILGVFERLYHVTKIGGKFKRGDANPIKRMNPVSFSDVRVNKAQVKK